MKKPIIGISGNKRPHPDSSLAVISYTGGSFVEAVEKVGGIPLVLPVVNEETAKAYVSMIDKLILTGGQNVDPSFYGEKKEIDSHDYSMERDLFEIALIKEALKQKKPIFSVCRGTQLFNVVKGGSLYQEIPNHWQEVDVDHLSQEVEIDEKTQLANFYPNGSCINSFHRQAIKEVGQDLEVIARSPQDQIIEAIQSTDGYPYLGVQWHPELMFDRRDQDLALFDYVVNKL